MRRGLSTNELSTVKNILAASRKQFALQHARGREHFGVTRRRWPHPSDHLHHRIEPA